MKEDEVSETIGAIGILIMLLILVILGINHFVGDPIGIH